MKPSAFAGFALQPNLTAHHLNQTGRDSQPQASSTILSSCGVIGLGERLEDQFLLFWGNPDSSIIHSEVQGDHLLLLDLAFHRHSNLTFLGKFDGVTNEIDYDLAQTSWITLHHGWHPRLHMAQEL